jgi:SP family facilitated glucose transporter-like MFS transporter 8
LTAIVSGVLPILFSVIIWFLPESPVWLMQKGRYDDACSSLMKLRHTKVQTTVQDELDQIAEKARSSRAQSLSFRNAVKTMLQPRAYKPLLLMNFFFFFQQVSGAYVVMFYAVSIIMFIIKGTDNSVRVE